MSKKKSPQQPAPPKPNAFKSPPCWMCKSENTIVTSTRNRVRYVKCRDCGETFTKAGPIPARVRLPEDKPPENAENQ